MAAKHTKKKKTTRGRPKKEQQNQEIRGEIIILIALAVCILLVLSNFGMGGIVGEAVSSVLFGLFGIMAYILPFAAFGISAFLVSNRGNAHAYIKIGAAIVLFLLLTAVFGLIFDQYEPGISLLTHYHRSSIHQNAGGLTGGCIISLFCPLIGEIGTYVVLFVLCIICVILITEKSLLAPLGRKSKAAYEDAKKETAGDSCNPGKAERRGKRKKGRSFEERKRFRRIRKAQG